MSDFQKQNIFFYWKKIKYFLNQKREDLKDYHINQITGITYDRLKIFDGVQCISPENKAILQPRIIKFEARLARHDAAINLDLFLQFFFCFIAILPMLSLVFIFNYLYDLGYNTSILVAISSIGPTLAIMLINILLWPFEYINSRNPIIVISKVSLLISLLSALALIMYEILDNLSKQNSWYLLIIGSGLGGVFIYLFALGITLFISAIIRRYLSSRLLDRFPDALLANSFLKVISKLENQDPSWRELYVKKEIMKELEKAATLVEKKFAPALDTSDLYYDKWLNLRLSGIAASIRAKKSWICMPNQNTREHLLDIFSTAVIAVAHGRFDSLEIEELQKNDRKKVIHKAYVLLTGIITSILPFTIYYVALKIGIIPKGKLKEYLEIMVLLWAIISILFAMDPHFKDKLDSLKNATALFPGTPTKKKN